MDPDDVVVRAISERLDNRELKDELKIELKAHKPATSPRQSYPCKES